MVLGGSVRLGVLDGDLDAAGAVAGEAYETAVGTRDLPVLASVGVALAGLVAGRGDAGRAARMLGAAARLRGADDPTSAEIRALTATLRSALGDDGFTAAYAAGAALERAAAIACLAPDGP
jgi:hypothetical protein